MTEHEQPSLPGLPPFEELARASEPRPAVARVPADRTALDPRVRRALATLDEQPELSLVTLANALGITRATLIRIVREAIGVTPKQYAADVRARRTP
ncbi:hypothetical protein KXS11_16110 [Plantibacter flavus]|uniref:hypothetical protein n=1 Tax=Plantibacter flavus TaxID=150123 RepID=UPI003F171D65